MAEIPIAAGKWAYEPKFDGFRCVALCSGDRVTLQSRRGKSLTRCFPDVVEAVSSLQRDAVLDGELVLWHDGRLDFAKLQRRLGSTAALSAVHYPAAYVVFDLLAYKSVDLRAKPYRKRRAKLEKLLRRGLPDGLVLMPMSTEPSVAEAWMRNHSEAGIEGVVAKRVEQPYRCGRGGWKKIRSRGTAEAVVGGVVGDLVAPEALLLGLPDGRGRLRVAGRTTALTLPARRELGGLLVPPQGVHPWPERIPASRFGQLGAEPVDYTPTEPLLVVEVDADVCFEQDRWRHATIFRRVRSDLEPVDLAHG
jgi:ATP-dependent DNA ligase